jgi:hypothetical protein
VIIFIHDVTFYLKFIRWVHLASDESVHHNHHPVHTSPSYTKEYWKCLFNPNCYFCISPLQYKLRHYAKSREWGPSTIPYSGEHMQAAANYDLSQNSETIHPFSIPFKYFTEHKCQDPWSTLLRLWLTFSETWDICLSFLSW